MHHLRDPEDIHAAVTLPVGVVSPGAFFPLRETLVPHVMLVIIHFAFISSSWPSAKASGSVLSLRIINMRWLIRIPHRAGKA
jgi:hypothetical protein